jgi:hypothetical protein
MALIWPNYLFSSEIFLPNKLLQWMKNNVFCALINGLTNDVTELITIAFRKKSTATLLQGLIVSHTRAMQHCCRHWKCHTTEHCHIGAGTHSITKQSTVTVVEIPILSYKRALPHWYRHSQCQKQCSPVLISYISFVHIIFECINSEHLFTCVYAVVPEDHPPSCTNVTIASLLHVVLRFHCVILYHDSNVKLHDVQGDNFIINIKTSLIIYIYIYIISRSICVPISLPR